MNTKLSANQRSLVAIMACLGFGILVILPIAMATHLACIRIAARLITALV